MRRTSACRDDKATANHRKELRDELEPHLMGQDNTASHHVHQGCPASANHQQHHASHALNARHNLPGDCVDGLLSWQAFLLSAPFWLQSSVTSDLITGEH